MESTVKRFLINPQCVVYGRKGLKISFNEENIDEKSAKKAVELCNELKA